MHRQKFHVLEWPFFWLHNQNRKESYEANEKERSVLYNNISDNGYRSAVACAYNNNMMHVAQ